MLLTISQRTTHYSVLSFAILCVENLDMINTLLCVENLVTHYCIENAKLNIIHIISTDETFIFLK